MTKKPTEIVSTQIRIPSPLHRRLAKAAEVSRRSLNEEIVWRLEQSVNPSDESRVDQVLRLLPVLDMPSSTVSDIIKAVREKWGEK